MRNDLMISIEENLHRFSKSQKIIADYIIHNYDKVVFMTASKLGGKVGVSESTVVRFAMELGFSGYPALQKYLRESIKHKLTSVQRFGIINYQLGGTDDILEKVLSNDIDKIKKTIDNVPRENFKNAVKKIVESDTIYIIGMGSSSALAQFLFFYFNLIFKNVKLINNFGVGEVFENIFNIGNNDLIIGISFPRYSKITLEGLRYALDCNAHTIAITDSYNSPVAEYAKNILVAQNNMISFVDSIVAPLSLINALIIAVGIEKEKEINENFTKLERIWSDYDIYEKFD